MMVSVGERTSARVSVSRGKTPVLTPDEAHKLLDSIDVTAVVGLRDRALIGMMAYSFARVSGSGSANMVRGAMFQFTVPDCELLCSAPLGL